MATHQTQPAAAPTPDRAALPPVETLILKLYEGAWGGAPKGRGFGRMRLVSTPEGAQDLLADHETFAKEYDLLTELGRSRFDAAGEDWAARRALTQPMLREAARTARAPGVASAYAARLDALRPGEPPERALLSAAGDIFAEMWDAGTDGAALADWILSTRGTAQKVQRIAMYGTDPAELAALREEVAAMRARADAILARDEALAAAVSGMARRMPPAGAGAAPFDPLGEFIIMLFAGTETSVSSILWALWELGRRPDAQERIAAAVAAGGARAPELEVFVQESMRFWPPVPMLTRRVTRPGARINGRPVPEGTVLALDIVGLHHDPAHWDAPQEFRPDRAEFRDGTWHRRAFLPFSAGPRVCGGSGIARLEVHAALAETLRRFRVRAPSGPSAIEYALTLRPGRPDLIRLEPRDG